MKLAKKFFIMSISVVFMFLSLFIASESYKEVYAAHSDYFTQSTTKLSKYEVLINVVTKQEMNNFVVNIDYLAADETVIASDVKSLAHLDENQRYQFVFNMIEVMSETDWNKCDKYSYNFTYDEQNYRIINNGNSVDSRNGSTTNDKSAFENALITALGKNYVIILLAIAGGAIVLICVVVAIKKPKK